MVLKIQQKESEILSGLFHLLCADLGSGWGGSWPLFDLYPGLGVQVWETGREAPGHRLEVWHVWFNLGLLLYWAGGHRRTCRRWSHYHHWSDLSIKTFIWGSFQISTKSEEHLPLSSSVICLGINSGQLISWEKSVWVWFGTVRPGRGHFNGSSLRRIFKSITSTSLLSFNA